MNKKQSNVKILVAYHKPAPLLKNNIFVPIHGGRAIAQQKSKDGIISSKDLGWLKKHTIGDNSGDNISDMNRFLNEMTVIYWAWKNQKELGNPDFIGLTHYRRHFILDSDDNCSTKEWLPGSSMYIYEKIDKNYEKMVGDKIKLQGLLEKYDILCSKKYDLNNLNDGHYYKNCKERFVVLANSRPIWYDKMNMVIKKYFPEYKKEMDYLNTHPSHYLCNMFVMKKDVFDGYCRFAFGVLLKLYDSFKKEEHYDIWSQRALAFLSEFLTSMYIQKYKNTHKTKVKELCLTYLADDMTFLTDSKKNQTTVKLFCFLPIYKFCRYADIVDYRIFGISVWKIRKMANNITTKYYFCGIPICKVSKR